MLNKKNRIGVAAGIAALVLAGNIFATTPGVYVGAQLGYADWRSSPSSSASPGNAFLGDLVDQLAPHNADAVMGRLFAGYQFNPYVAAEMGYSKFSDATFKDSCNNCMVAGTFLMNSFVKESVSTQSVDLVAKGMLPLLYGLGLYGKAGVAYVNQSLDRTATTTPVGGTTITETASNTINRFFPTFGLGLSYDINTHLTTDLSWGRIQSTNADEVSSIDAYSVGLIYSFG